MHYMWHVLTDFSSSVNMRTLVLILFQLELYLTIIKLKKRPKLLLQLLMALQDVDLDTLEAPVTS